MAYLHINNLYKDTSILMFKEVYALEKIHGTSAHINFGRELTPDQKTDYIYKIEFFSGGEKYDNFVKLFNQIELLEKFKELNIDNLVIYGEAYGGKQQGMSATYGKELKFVAFDVKINYSWLRVPQAVEIVNSFGLEFVYYTLVKTDLEELDKARDAHSRQAVRNGMGEDKKSEGIVLRPIIELTKNNGERLIAKHKRIEFQETKTPRDINIEKLEILEDANAIAEEWVTLNRLKNILSKTIAPSIEMIGTIIKTMLEDIGREAKDEVVWSKEVRGAISRKTANLFKMFLNNSLQ